MGLFDDLVTKVAAKAGGSPPHRAMTTAIFGMLNRRGSDGLPGLLRAFREKGLGDVVSSWIGTGANLPISADQVEAVVGNDKVGELAWQTGVPPAVAKSLLADILPGLVDHLTPKGTVPSGSWLGDALDFAERASNSGRSANTSD